MAALPADTRFFLPTVHQSERMRWKEAGDKGQGSKKTGEISFRFQVFFIWVQQKDTFRKIHINKGRENTGFHKSAALMHHRAVEANRREKKNTHTPCLKRRKKNKHRKARKRQKNGWEREIDRKEERTACYHGDQRKTSCLQPIHQLPATTFCLSHSLFSSLLLSSASLYLSYVWR